MKIMKLDYLKKSNYKMVVYKDENGIIQTSFLSNLTNEAIKKLFVRFEILTIVGITLKDYIRKVLSFDEIEVTENKYFKVQFYQKDVFKCDKYLNNIFPEFLLTLEEIKEIKEVLEIPKSKYNKIKLEDCTCNKKLQTILKDL